MFGFNGWGRWTTDDTEELAHLKNGLDAVRNAGELQVRMRGSYLSQLERDMADQAKAHRKSKSELRLHEEFTTHYAFAYFALLTVIEQMQGVDVEQVKAECKKIVAERRDDPEWHEFLQKQLQARREAVKREIFERGAVFSRL